MARPRLSSGSFVFSRKTPSPLGGGTSIFDKEAVEDSHGFARLPGQGLGRGGNGKKSPATGPSQRERMRNITIFWGKKKQKKTYSGDMSNYWGNFSAVNLVLLKSTLRATPKNRAGLGDQCQGKGTQGLGERLLRIYYSQL